MSGTIASSAADALAADAGARAVERAPAIVRTANAVLLAAAMIAVGLTWDIAWHRSVAGSEQCGAGSDKEPPLLGR